MKRALGIIAALALAIGGSALADIAQLSQPVIYALTPIDTLPSASQINSVHNDSEAEARSNLEAIALSPPGVDAGVQLRAIRALPHYCQSPCNTHSSHATLVDVIATPRYRDARSGTDVLVLRATLEALGVMRVPADIDVIVPHLEHPSRDIRAAAARALRDLGNVDAIVPLRARYQNETNPQVRTAISDALRVLGQP
jgi:hypothetical protein